MKKKYLSIVLLEDIPFQDLILKFEDELQTQFPYRNHDGRLIAKGNVNALELKIIDRIDGLGDFLSDDHHVLDIATEYTGEFNFQKVEDEIRFLLHKSNVKWKHGIWSGDEERINETSRKIEPLSSQL